MTSKAYITGVLSALVKSGEVSPMYADGIMDTLTKQAWWGWDSTADDYADYVQSHPEMQQQNGGFKIDPSSAVKLMDSSKHWWQGDGVSWGDELGNMWDKWTRWWPGTHPDKTGDFYDLQHKIQQNKARMKDMQERAAKGEVFAPELWAAVQDQHMQDAKDYYDYVKQHGVMSQSEMEAEGLNENFADQFRTTQGDAAVRGGLYNAKNFTVGSKEDMKPKGPAYGENLSNLYGSNKGMFFRRGLGKPSNPTAKIDNTALVNTNNTANKVTTPAAAPGAPANVGTKPGETPYKNVSMV